MIVVDAKHDLTSIGCLCGQLQHSLRAIEAAALELGLAPALRLNGIPHFSGDQVDRIAEHLRSQSEGR